MSISQQLKHRFRRLWLLRPDRLPTDELLDMVRRSQDPAFGDYQANFAMPLGKRLGRPPREVAAEMVGPAGRGRSVPAARDCRSGLHQSAASRRVARRRLAAAATDPRLGIAAGAEPRTYVIDYSAPNVAKPMHVGTSARRSSAMPWPNAAFPRPSGDHRQSHRRLGHAVRHDHLRLPAFLRQEAYRAESGGRTGGGFIGGPGADGRSKTPMSAAAVLAETASCTPAMRKTWHSGRSFCRPAGRDRADLPRLGRAFDYTLGESFYHAMLGRRGRASAAGASPATAKGPMCVFLGL